jgi:CheY-like chemotaxis protein
VNPNLAVVLDETQFSEAIHEKTYPGASCADHLGRYLLWNHRFHSRACELYRPDAETDPRYSCSQQVKLTGSESSEMRTEDDMTEQPPILVTNVAKSPKILVADDNARALATLVEVLKVGQFDVTEAANVSEALHWIDSGPPFDVLLCDLHMPGPGDGLTVVSAMRHKNPKAVTLVFTGYPALDEAMDAIRLQVDEVLVKPMAVPMLLGVIHDKLEKRTVRTATNTERVASILERDAERTINNWLARVEKDDELTIVQLNREQRTGHLPALFHELVRRLRVPRSLGTKQTSAAAVQHGKVRQFQGYSVAMIVEESRILQVSIFQTLQNNLASVDFNSVLIDVMTIADEVDSQLKQTLVSVAERTAEVAA